jgi:hypothetical protein
MNRRGFFGLLAALPFVGWIVPKKLVRHRDEVWAEGTGSADYDYCSPKLIEWSTASINANGDVNIELWRSGVKSHTQYKIAPLLKS